MSESVSQSVSQSVSESVSEIISYGEVKNSNGTSYNRDKTVMLTMLTDNKYT